MGVLSGYGSGGDLRDMDVVPFNEAMKTAESGLPFKVGFCTADYKRKRAGEYLEYGGVTLRPLDKPKVKTDGVQKGDGVEKDLNLQPYRPSHRQNDTRHLNVPGQNRPLKFHPRLMIMFNDKEVLY